MRMISHAILAQALSCDARINPIEHQVRMERSAAYSAGVPEHDAARAKMERRRSDR